MHKALVIFIGVFVLGQRAQACGAADDRLIDLFPKRRRPHEGFVVKPCREKAVQLVVDRHRVQLEAGPSVLACRLQPVEEFGHRRPRIRFLPRARAQMDQRVRFFRPCRQRPARAVILKATPHQPHAIGEQRRGQSVARMADIAVPVKGKAEALRAVNLAARNAIGLAHLLRPCALATSRASSTLVISWVTVLRVTTSHDRSPCS